MKATVVRAMAGTCLGECVATLAFPCISGLHYISAWRKIMGWLMARSSKSQLHKLKLLNTLGFQILKKYSGVSMIG